MKNTIELTNYLPLIYSEIRKMNVPKHEWQELQSEATLCFFETLSTFDPKKGEFGGYFKTCVRRHLFSYFHGQNTYYRVQNEKTFTTINYDIGDLEHLASEENDYTYNLAFKSLSEDSKEIISTIDPNELKDSLGRRVAKITYNVIYNIIESWGWTKERILLAFNELKDYFLVLKENNAFVQAI